MKYNTATLPSGLRVIHLPSVSPVVYCGYQIAAGTRHELPGEEGLAHFCEHVTFKGTERRTALQVINTLEELGGELNAYTNKESTTFYAAVLKDHFMEAADLLTDIVFHSQYPQEEIDKEIEVICDEIESYNDSPAELIYDEFENILFKDHPLGHNILGEADQLRTYTTADALRFTHRGYRRDNAIFFVYGSVAFEEVLDNLNGLDKMDGPRKDMPEPSGNPLSTSSPSTITRHRNTHQAHVLLGTRTFGYHDERRMPLYLLNNILGGPGMNARLNLLLREKYGLVYTVESNMTTYSDTGFWSVYFGCDAEDIERCRELVRQELDIVMQEPLTVNQLRKAKMQLKGQLAIACDNREQFALDFSKSFLHYGWERNLDQLMARIDAITAEQIQQVAQQLFLPGMITTLIYK
ncbi:MAG: insulinase family protein [Prevotella sp.]|nr:insulinase family protein [Prevotella sp.]